MLKLKTKQTLWTTALLCSVSFCSWADNPNNFNGPPADTPSPSPTTPSETDDNTQGLNTSAFQKLLNDYFPLSPTQIHQFKNVTAEQQAASVQAPGKAPPEGTSTIIPVTLKPGGVMPVIRIGPGMITSLVFIDASGQVWPVSSYSIGDPTSFNVEWDKKSAVLMIQGQKLFAQTNIGVMLQGMNIPIMINLMIGQKQWDYLDYIQMDANQPGDSGQPIPVAQAPSYLTDLLNGLPPQGALQQNVSDSSLAQVWLYQGQYIMVTHATLLSPAYVSKADGPGSQPLHAYALPQAPELILSNMGKIEKLIISTGASDGSSS